jgi:hypothetical protein
MCARYATAPSRVVGEDFEYVHAAGAAQFCPDDVFVQITACVQVAVPGGWDDVGCLASRGAWVRPETRGGRGQGLSFDVPCVTGLLRTHVEGGEGLRPTEWDSDSTQVTCAGRPYWAPSPAPASSPSADEAGWSAPAAVKGDFNGDGFSDLAIGVPGENSGAGAVQILYGSAAGLTATGSRLWSQNSVGVADTAEPGDGFGSALAVGDLNGDGRADLAVGVPGEDAGAIADSGVVQVLYGSASGLVGTGSQWWSQNSVGVADSSEAGDRFGSALAVADFGGGAEDDLAIGVPREDAGAIADSGAVQVLYGSASGVVGAGSQVWSQNSAGVADSAEPGDRFGGGLAR